MDDPLIGLTFWQNDNSRKPPGPRKLAKKRAVDGRGGKQSLDSNKAGELAGSSSSSKRERTPLDTNKKSSSKKGTTKKGIGDLDCFPCLPGIEMDREKELCDLSEGSSSGPCSPSHEGSIGGRSTPEKTAAVPSLIDSNLLNSPVPQPQNFWLMRLFQSKLFDMSIAIGYLFNSKEADVQAYLGNKLFVSSPAWFTVQVHSLAPSLWCLLTVAVGVTLIMFSVSAS